MTDWFRSWRGAPTDNKWLVIGRKAGVAPGMVSAVFWALLDHASEHDERGTVADFDVEVYAAFSGFEDRDIAAIVVALEDKGVIVDGRLAGWERRQPKGAVSGRARMRPTTEVWSALRAIVFRRDDFTCRYCGARGVRLECDHVVPVVRGGTHDLENLVAACRQCNRSKGAKSLEEWR